MDKKSCNKRLWNPSAKLINYFARFFCKKKRDSINFVKILVIQNCFYYRQCLGSLRVTVWKISEQLSAVLFFYLYSIRYFWIILPVQTIWKYTSNWVVAGSSVSPEAPLMVQSTIIFLFRICLGVLINLLRIHNSIYQNNGILPFSLLAKAMRKELCWDSDIFDLCEKDDFYLFDTCHRKDVSWGLKSDHSALLGSQHSECVSCQVTRGGNKRSFSGHGIQPWRSLFQTLNLDSRCF